MTMGPTGPSGPKGPQGAWGPHGNGLGHPDLPDGRVADPTTQREALRRIEEFFSSANKTRAGLELSCPHCGAATVVKARGRDGRMFLGCSQWPRCSGTWDIPEASQREAKKWENQVMTSAHTDAMLPNRASEMADAVSDAAYMMDPNTGEIHDGLDGPRAGRRKGKPATPFLDKMIDEVLSSVSGANSLATIAWKDEVFHTFHVLKDFRVGQILQIRRDDQFYFDGKTLLYRDKERYLPELRGALSVDWLKHLGQSETQEIAAYMARIKKEKAMKESAMDEAAEDVPSTSVKARLARSAKKAPIRVARMRAISEGKKAILGALKPRLKASTFDLIEAFLDTDAGQGAILSLVGLAGPYTPKIGKNKHVQAVCDEFLEEGVALGANEVFGLLGMILEPVLKSIMSQLPGVEEIADKVVPKRQKKRVATPVRVKRDDEPEEEEDATPEPRRKNALRAIG